MKRGRSARRIRVKYRQETGHFHISTSNQTRVPSDESSRLLGKHMTLLLFLALAGGLAALEMAFNLVLDGTRPYPSLNSMFVG